MHLLSPGPAHGRHDPVAGGAPHNGVVHQHHPLALHRGPQGVQLQIHGVLPLGLGGEDKAAADVSVFHKARGNGDAAFQGVAHGRLQAAVRYAADQIRLHGVLPGQHAAHVQPRLVDAEPVQHRVRPGKVHVFKDAQAVGRPQADFAVDHFAVFDEHRLAGLDVPHKAEAAAVQGAALRGHRHAAAVLPQAQGAVAVGVPDGHQLPAPAQHHQGVGPRQQLAGLLHAGEQIPQPDGLVGDEGGDHLTVAGGGEVQPKGRQLLPNFLGVHHVAVVGGGNAPGEEFRHKGLYVPRRVGARGGVPRVADGLPGRGHLLHHLGREGLRHQAHVLVADDGVAPGCGNARALLAPVLHGQQPVVADAGCLLLGVFL